MTKCYVRRVGDHNVQSDLLLELLADILLEGLKSSLPDPNEHCYLTFRVNYPPSQAALDNGPFLRIRVSQQHNDVALRLWEAGATLANYLVQNPRWVKGHSVVELGAGVGLTGLATSGCCGAKSVCCTDYTTACLENLRHNFDVNSDWLESRRGASNRQRLRVAYSDFDIEDRSGVSPNLDEAAEALEKATILLAADVAYDHSSISGLVRAIRFFPTSGEFEQDKRVSTCHDTAQQVHI